MLGQRDQRIFEALSTYRYLPSSYLFAFAGGASETRFKERLGDLFHEGFVARPEQQWQLANARFSPAIYELDVKGRRAIAAEPINRTYLGTNAHRQFSHALLVCEALASIELAVLGNPNVRFISWGEILSRAPAARRQEAKPFALPLETGGHLIPDGLCGLAYIRQGRELYRFFALEVDRATMPFARSNPGQTSYLARLEAYQRALSTMAHMKHWGLPNLIVLTLTTNEGHLQTMLKTLSSWAETRLAFAFKVLPAGFEFPAARLLEEPWFRPAAADLSIGDSG